MTEPRLTLGPRGRPYFLGQPAAVTATLAAGADGRPLADVAVTFVATWGRLRTSGTLHTEEGNAVTVRTGIEGSARVNLLPPTSEALTAEQQDALGAMVGLLDPAAAFPGAAEKGLREMVRHYRWEGGAPFREAVDIYLRDFRPRLLDTVNRADLLAAWSSLDATVLALAQDETAVVATAVLPLRFRDWLGPWLETYLAVAEKEGRLADELREVKTIGGDRGLILRGVYDRALDFVGRQRGDAGAWASRRIVNHSLEQLLDRELTGLAADDRTVLFGSLRNASGALAGGTAVLAAVGQTQVSLRDELSGKIPPADLGPLTARVDGLQTALGSKADAAALAQLQSSVTAKLDVTAFAGFQQQVATSLAGKADAAALAQFQTSVNAALATRASTAQLNELQKSVNTQLAAKLDTSVFKTFETDIRGQLDPLLERSTLVDSLRNELVTLVAPKADRELVDSLATRVDTDLAALRTESRQTTADLAALNTTVTGLGAELMRRRRGPFC